MHGNIRNPIKVIKRLYCELIHCQPAYEPIPHGLAQYNPRLTL